MVSASADNSMEVDDGPQMPGSVIDIDNLTPIEVPAPLPVAACGDGESGRLIISHITNVNFKSYAGTTILGPFQKVALYYLLLSISDKILMMLPLFHIFNLYAIIVVS